jgi:hypothetical protein
MGYTWMCLFLSLMEVVLSFVLIEKRFLVEVGRGGRCIPDLFSCLRLTSDPLLKVL